MIRSFFLGSASLLLVFLCALLGAGPERTVKVHVRLVDAATGKDRAGIVRVIPDKETKAMGLHGLLDRFQGLKVPQDIWGWHVLPAAEARLTLPRGKIRLEALSGLETALASKELDLSKDPPQKITIKLDAIFLPEKDNLASGNTHLHLMNLSK